MSSCWWRRRENEVRAVEEGTDPGEQLSYVGKNLHENLDGEAEHEDAANQCTHTQI